MKGQRRIIFRRLVGLFLLAAISVFIFPKELIHEFYHHEDSVDLICSDGCEGHISNEHQHCDVLQLNLPPLYFHVIGFSFPTSDLLCSLSVESCSNYHFASSPFLFFRGPPSLV